MVENFYQNKPVKPDRLKELIGHSPVQVLAGALLGMALTAFLF